MLLQRSSNAPQPFPNPRKSIENLSNIYRKSIEHLSNIYRKSIENLSNIYGKSIVSGSIWGGSGVDLGWIWGGSGKYLGGVPALVRTSSVDLEVSGVDLGSIWPSCALPPSAKIYWKSVETLSNIYRTSIENLSFWDGSGVHLRGIWEVLKKTTE